MHRYLVIAIAMGDVSPAKAACQLAGEHDHPPYWNTPCDYLEYRRPAPGLEK